MKAVIPAAGFGTRFIPATKSQPKEMLPVYDKPTIQHVIEEAVASGIDDILIITGRNKRSIEDHFDKSYELEYTLQKAGKDRVLKQVRKVTDLADICYVRQKNLRGLGDAISCAERHTQNEPFAVLLGDSITRSKTPCTKQLIDVFNNYKKPAIAVREVPNDKVCSYGIVKAEKVQDDVYRVDQLIEKPKRKQAPSNLAIVGRYILTPDIFEKINETEPGFNGEIQLTDALSKLNELYALKFDGDVFNIENRLEWIKSSIDYALHDDEFRDDLINYMKTFVG